MKRTAMCGSKPIINLDYKEFVYAFLTAKPLETSYAHALSLAA